MLKIPLYFVVNIISILALSKLLPTFEVTGLFAAFMFVVFLTLLNITVIPVIKFLTFPINFITLGLFHGLVNIITIGIVANTIVGVQLSGTNTDKFLTSFVIAISLSVAHAFVGKLSK
jgi:putative membrane protein